MASNQDARPFVDLRKDAKEFKEKFDEDIEKIIMFLDAKITALICDPDSLESPSKKGVIKSTALVEFSKAKFEIFNNVKTVTNQMEREWLKYISEMKKLFIENVEIFLAGTKLEVKLPTDEFRTSPSYKQSPRKDKSSLAESIYPIIPMINTFAKNMAALGSPFQKKDNTPDSRRRSRELLKDHQAMLDQLEDSRTKLVLQSSASKRGNKNLSRAMSSSPKNYTSTESSASDSESQTDSDMSRSSRTKSAQETPIAPPSPKKSNLASSSVDLSAPKSPKKVTFIPMQEMRDDTDVFTPNVKSKAALRRKTLLPNLDIAMSDAGSTPGVSRNRGKRKTIGGISDLTSTTPPKRLKMSERVKSVSPSQAEDDADNLLESDGKYSDWIPLKSIDAKVPSKSGIYEVKVFNAKKSAYIGHCESLRQKLTLHKLQHNSGHKHLDKFIERNKNGIQIRYEVFPSLDAAKSEVKNRVKSFTAQYNTTPAYN